MEGIRGHSSEHHGPITILARLNSESARSGCAVGKKARGMDGEDALEAMSAMGVVRSSVIGDADGRRLMRVV